MAMSISKSVNPLSFVAISLLQTALLIFLS